MRVREGRAAYGRFVITVTGLLLTLGVRGVGWGLTQFLEIDQPIGNVRFSSLTGGGTCEDGTYAGCNCDITTGLQTGAPGAPCTSGVACTGGACVEFDWANGPDSAGICSPPTIGVPISCPPTSDNGLFDGGVFNGAEEPPSVPWYIGTDPAVPPGAHGFAADALGIATATASACNKGPNFGLSCAGDADCSSPVVAGSCQFCGTGDPTVYTG